MTLKELRERRLKLAQDARAIIKKAEDEKRNLTTEERNSYDKMFADITDLKGDIDRLEKIEAEERDLASSQGRKAEPGTPGSTAAKDRVFELRSSICGDARRIVIAGEWATQDYTDAFRRFLVGGERNLNGDEIRALQRDSDTGGGYLSAPMEFMAELIQAVDNLTFMRQKCRVLPPLTTADSLGAPSLDSDPADPTWTGELSIGNEDTSMAFGRRELKPHVLAQFIKVSKTLLRRSAISADAIVRDRLAYKVGVVMENGYLNGSGANQPLGIFTASAMGISTARDFSTGNTQTEIRFDGLKEAEYALKAQYRRVAEWVLHRDAVKQIAKLKDGEGRYIWQPSVQVGQPDRLLNMPINESEYAPNTFTSGNYVGILGDLRNYWIVDALTLTIQVLLELYAATNQNGYLSRIESDGMPILEEAFARVKLA